MSVGIRLRELRKSLKLSQLEFSASLNVTQSAISQIEKNIISPSFDILTKISNTYFINLNWLITGEGSMFLSDQKNENLNKSSSLESKEVSELQKKISDLEKEIKAIEFLNNKFEKKNKELSDELIKRLQQVADLSQKMLDLQS